MSVQPPDSDVDVAAALRLAGFAAVAGVLAGLLWALIARAVEG